MLEHVVELQKIADDDVEDAPVRQAAAEALIDLNRDGKVEGRYLRVKLAQSTATLGRTAEDESTSDVVRNAARAELSALARTPSLKAAAKQSTLAMRRLTEIQKTEHARTAQEGWSDADPFLRQKHEVRKLVDLLRREHGWWNHFDPNLIGTYATDEQWDLISSAAAGATALISSAAIVRATGPESARQRQ